MSESEKIPGMPEMPDSPTTPMHEMFVHLHEMFVGMKDSGFTDWQACRIIGVWMAEQGRQS